MPWKRIAPGVYSHPKYGKLMHRMVSEEGDTVLSTWTLLAGSPWIVGSTLSAALTKALEHRRDSERRQRAAELSKAKSLTPEKVKARSAVICAIRAGKLKRLPCEECGATPTVGHHDDYADRLGVRWLCHRHHRQWHAKHGEGANGGFSS
jgi:hypothetical protein